MRRDAARSIIRAIALDATEVDRRRVIALGVIGRQADRRIAEFQRVLPRRAPLGRTRAGRDVAGAERAVVTERVSGVGLQLILQQVRRIEIVPPGQRIADRQAGAGTEVDTTDVLPVLIGERRLEEAETGNATS